MTIGIDGNEANVSKRVGISEYAYELMRYFSQIADKDTSFDVYLKSNPNEFMPDATKYWQYKVTKPRKLWTQLALPARLFLTRKKPSVFFSPTHYAPRFSPVPTVIAIMDMSFLRFPELFREKDLYQLRNWTAYSAKKASRIITISNASKNDIIAEYGIPEERVVVTYLGIKPAALLTPHIYPMQELHTKYDISSRYILFVGTLQPRKNIVKLIEAFAVLKKNQEKEMKDVQLVIVGKKGWLYEEILQAPEKNSVGNSVKFLDFVNDEDLAILYQHALFFVLPSLYEGFGLPVLEAMKHGCPVITSNVSSLPEAGGDAALYVDPTSVSDITSKMKELLLDEKKRKALREKGLKHCQNFNWEKTAKKTIAVLQEVAKS